MYDTSRYLGVSGVAVSGLHGLLAHWTVKEECACFEARPVCASRSSLHEYKKATMTASSSWAYSLFLVPGSSGLFPRLIGIPSAG